MSATHISIESRHHAYPTGHFESVQAALAFYAAFSDNPRALVACKLADGDIAIGRPLLRHEQALRVQDGRYHVTEGGR
jgi:hypothetical protein